MDEKEFLKAHARVNDRPCVFSKAVLRQCCSCSRSQKLFIAGREVIACKSPGAHDRCSEMLELLHGKATFALHIRQGDTTLPHGKEIKVQCGSMHALTEALAEAGRPNGSRDIYTLIDEAESCFGSLAKLPYNELVKGITQFKSRGRD